MQGLSMHRVGAHAIAQAVASGVRPAAAGASRGAVCLARATSSGPRSFAQPVRPFVYRNGGFVDAHRETLVRVKALK
eukprot:176904-Rhodomonas_salina.2